MRIANEHADQGQDQKSLKAKSFLEVITLFEISASKARSHPC